MSAPSANSRCEPASDGSAAPSDSAPRAIRIRGARVHNLRNLDLDIPHDRLVVLTGLSGSGKSSLAFDTVYAEGQRQYIETLSVYARQFLHQLERPDVDEIDGLQPTLAIDQRSGSANPRSTVATVTEIHDYLRLLYARLGVPHCYQCGAAIRQQSPEQMLDEILRLPERAKVMVLAPLVRGRKGQHAEVFEAVRKAGFVRVRIDGQVCELEAVPELSRQKKHHIEAVVDRLIVREGIRPRLADSLRMALKHGEGVVVITYLPPAPAEGSGETWRDLVLSSQFACPDCRLSYEEIEPRTFSFNSPYGACPLCEGLGSQVSFDPELVLPDSQRSVSQGAIAPWRGGTAALARRQKKLLAPWLDSGGDSDLPLEQWKPRQRERFWLGDGAGWIGLRNLLQQQYATAVEAADRERLELFRTQVPCSECGGSRLRREARTVQFQGRPLAELVSLTIAEAAGFFAAVRFSPLEQPIGQPIVSQINSRLGFLRNVGLDYLTLDRTSDTLSGGEAQRIRLASSIGSGLVNVCYVLDEPSIGLHPRDNDRLIASLLELRDQGNSVLVVEHDEALMRRADQLIDLGPGPGRLGGQIVAQGTPAEVAGRGDSLTGRYLAGELTIEVPATRRPANLKKALVIEGVTTNNLKNLTVAFPLSALVCVTGVSGSGKSSLVNETLVPAVARQLGQGGPKAGPHTSLKGAKQLDKLVVIDQSSIGRTPRSSPATYTGVFDEVRKVFAATREAKLRGYKASRFSFNVAGGRCEACQGQGVRKVEMNFLPDLYVACPECEGRRFNRQTLEIHYRGRSISDVLDQSIDEAQELFVNHPALDRLLRSLQSVGLGYLSLGQSSLTLSGGEAQRIKLATELARTDTGRTLYVLDEPTTGLHFEDIRKLLAVLMRLVELGNSVVLIEHHLDLIKAADWVIDLGPEGGAAGGYLLAEGTPERLAAVSDNATGAFLRPLLAAGGLGMPPSPTGADS